MQPMKQLGSSKKLCNPKLQTCSRNEKKVLSVASLTVAVFLGAPTDSSVIQKGNYPPSTMKVSHIHFILTYSNVKPELRLNYNTPIFAGEGNSHSRGKCGHKKNSFGIKKSAKQGQSKHRLCSPMKKRGDSRKKNRPSPMKRKSGSHKKCAHWIALRGNVKDSHQTYWDANKPNKCQNLVVEKMRR